MINRRQEMGDRDKRSRRYGQYRLWTVQFDQRPFEQQSRQGLQAEHVRRTLSHRVARVAVGTAKLSLPPDEDENKRFQNSSENR